MTLQELSEYRRRFFLQEHPYQLTEWQLFNYSLLKQIIYRRKGGNGDDRSVNDIIIMADTETSKKPDLEHNRVYNNAKDAYTLRNHVVCWTISIRAFGINIVTLYGRKPSHMIECLTMMHNAMKGEKTFIFFHNLSYDWQFIRKYCFQGWGFPIKQLSTKSHYPINIEFENGLIIKDSLILAQRSLDRWAKDMNVEHQKAVGKWDYSQLRTQSTELSEDELEYIEHDTLAGVECIDVLLNSLNKHIGSIPYTATGIVREEIRKKAAEHNARELFKKIVNIWQVQLFAQNVYHGGYTHANRHEIGFVNNAIAMDFASSYPYSLLAFKYPMDKFTPLEAKSCDFIMKYRDKYAFMFNLILENPRLKSNDIAMPYLQYGKCTRAVNAVTDNGRVLAAGMVQIPISELDLEIILDQYDFDAHICCDVLYAKKDYLPRWLTDYVYQLFEEKTLLKGKDPVLYALAKAKLNSIYGCMVMKPCRDDIQEDYLSGEYITMEEPSEEMYEKWTKKRTSVLSYNWGVWCTAYATNSLFKLGKCVNGTWLYSDTDSIYATSWDMDKVEEYNNNVKKILTERGYGAVYHNGREYWLGLAELDGEYSEFKTLGAKRYCCRYADTGELKLTISGVPKASGVKCLDNDIKNFKKGFIFSGEKTGKLTHTYQYVDEIYIDDEGNETADSVDLTACDYLLDTVKLIEDDNLYIQDVNVTIYG